MDKALREGIENILRERSKVQDMQEGIKEAIQILAARFDMKPAQLNKVISLVEKERDKGGVLEQERTILETAEEALL